MSPATGARRTEPAYSMLHHPGELSHPRAVPDLGELLGVIVPLLDDPPNPRQREAVEASFQHRQSLLWGPPGTGKTTVLALMGLAWLEHANMNDRPITIGIGANNWNAIDHLQAKIEELVARRRAREEYARPVRFARVRSNYGEPLQPGRIIDDIARKSPAASRLVEDLNDGESTIVVAGTWQQLSKMASDHHGSEPIGPWFDLLLVDEASQLKVAPAAAYYLLLKPDAHAVVAGDPRQLGPIYSFEVRDTAGGLLDCIFTYLRETHQAPLTALVRNYRTNVEIADWPRARFYNEDYAPEVPDRRLDVTVPSDRPSEWPAGLPWSSTWRAILDPNVPVVAVTYSGRPYTLSNAFEAQAVAALACLYRLAVGQEIPEAQFWSEHLGIVTPHRAQMAQIRTLLQSCELFDEVPVVDTVDRFQGRERDVILASYAVADRDFIRSEESFILNPRRFNVTLTRARKKFVMMISDGLVQHLPSDLDVATEAAHLQLFIEEYCTVVDHTIDVPFVNEGVEEVIQARLRGHQR